MSDDGHFLSALTRAARGGDVLLDPRWEAFCAGTLSAEEHEALRAEARAAGLSDEDIALLQPPSEGDDERLIAGVLRAASGPVAARPGAEPPGAVRAAEGAEPRGSASTPPLPGGAGGSHPESDQGRATSAGRPPRARPRPPLWAFAAAIVGVAAGAALLLRDRGGEGERWPSYALVVEGGAQDTRSAPAPDVVPLFFPDTPITLVARPARDAPAGGEARAFLSTERTSGPWDVPIEMAEGGAVRVRGRAGALLASAPAGRLKVCVAVGPGAVVRAMKREPEPPQADAGYAVSCRFVEWRPEGAAP